MSNLTRMKVANGIYWVEVPEADVRVLCGCPADSVKQMMRRGLIVRREADGVDFETGPNAILLSDVPVQKGSFANLAEFPVMQMLYRQGMGIPGHPNNTGARPVLIGSAQQVTAQLRYIHRGIYGLVSEEEMTEAGLPPDMARTMIHLKSELAYGTILPTEDLVDCIIVDGDRVEIDGGVSLRRLASNVFQFRYGGESVTVDLNLAPGENYEVPYTLGYHLIERGYWMVVHSGNGDGWDAGRPAMSSVLIFQGKVYLVDAGPNVLHSLQALGISANEIEGIFHTHAHDDHFCGLTALMRSDRRIRYFAAPWVRDSVARKLSALLSMDRDDVLPFFEVHDLETGVWNDIAGLQVMPMFSPHPVETTVFMFRAASGAGYRSYAHLGDIITLSVLEEMISGSPEDQGIPRELFEQVRRAYLTQATVKKIDIGGAPVHGSAEDFREDESDKIILSHTARELTDREKEIGSGATFGSADVLIASHQDYVRDRAARYLRSYFPSVPQHELEILLNNPIVSFNPETIILRAGERNTDIHLLLTGDVDVMRPVSRSRAGTAALSAGGVVGEHSALSGTPSEFTCRTANCVRALRVPCRTYVEFIRRNGLLQDIQSLQAAREFLASTWLFSEGISYPVQNRIARAMRPQTLEACPEPQSVADSGIRLVRDGEVQLLFDDSPVEELSAGDFYGESSVLYGTPGLLRVRTDARAEIYRLPADAVRNIPVVRLKLLEVYQRRMRLLLDPRLVSTPVFCWREQYATGVDALDGQHRRLFEMTERLHQAMDSGAAKPLLTELLNSLIEHAETHFDDEEQLMADAGFPGLERHRRRHKRLLAKARDFANRLAHGEIDLDESFVAFLKDWIVDHLLTEDHRYPVFLAETRAR